MSFYNKLQDALYDSTKAILAKIGDPNTKVLFSHENIREPDDTYCLINNIKRVQHGRRDETAFVTVVDGVGTSEFIAHYSLDIKLSFIGRDAEDVANDFQHNAKNNRSCLIEWERQNLGLLYVSDVRSVPQKRDTQWVDMFNMDIRLSFALSTIHEEDWIEKITIVENYVP